jgi:hypothetical protein
MAIAIRSLNTGQTTTSINLVGPVAANKAVIVKAMRFVNTGTSAATLNLTFTKSGGIARKIAPSNLTLPVGALYTDDAELTMEQNDVLTLTVANGQPVDYNVSGIERDQ